MTRSVVGTSTDYIGEHVF